MNKDCIDPAMENFVKKVWIPGEEANRLQEYLENFEVPQLYIVNLSCMNVIMIDTSV